MGQRRYVLDRSNFNPTLGQRADSTFATATGAFYKYISFTHTCLYGHTGCIGSSYLSSIGCILFATTKAHFTGRRPGDNLTTLVGNADNDVVECSAYMHIACGFYLHIALFGSCLGAQLILLLCHFFFCKLEVINKNINPELLREPNLFSCCGCSYPNAFGFVYEKSSTTL